MGVAARSLLHHTIRWRTVKVAVGEERGQSNDGEREEHGNVRCRRDKRV